MSLNHSSAAAHSTTVPSLSGATRVYFIIGDPIAQVKSPAGVTAAFHAQQRDAILIPIQVAPAHLAEFIRATEHTKNVDGLIITVPHKFSACALCDTTSARSAFLGAANVLRRNAAGRWHGDMVDGLGFVSALQHKGCNVSGRKALLVGAGGAGSAIAHAVLEAGVAQLTIYDPDTQRSAGLVHKLQQLNAATAQIVQVGSNEALHHTLILNASPMGMGADDPLPVNLQGVSPDVFVGDVVTMPAIPAFIAQAQAQGLGYSSGSDMFAQVRDLMVDFFLQAT